VFGPGKADPAARRSFAALVLIVIMTGCRGDNADDWARTTFGEAGARAVLREGHLLGPDATGPAYLPRPFVVFSSDVTGKLLGFHVLNKTLTGVAQSREEIAAYVTVSKSDGVHIIGHEKMGGAPIVHSSKFQVIEIQIPDPKFPVSFKKYIEGHSPTDLADFITKLPPSPPPPRGP
jgi:hypothetical protein